VVSGAVDGTFRSGYELLANSATNWHPMPKEDARHQIEVEACRDESSAAPPSTDPHFLPQHNKQEVNMRAIIVGAGIPTGAPR